MYRVYDLKLKHWVKEPVYLSMNEDIYVSKSCFPNRVKLSLVSDERYMVQKDIGLCDRNKVPIFEGDIVSVEYNAEFTDEKGVVPVVTTGVVAYYPDHATFYLFDEEKSQYYSINKVVCEHLTIIGNTYDNPNLIPLQEMNS